MNLYRFIPEIRFKNKKIVVQDIFFYTGHYDAILTM